ncbi:alkaline phosphatase PafA [Spongiimicrobium sp. 3-5]|uniref:alkaline phosphatase PafA n=1 Tax=Spongiimicrobium sp. 3-5 TaxID=3332596 RepID=UPI00397EC48C
MIRNNTLLFILVFLFASYPVDGWAQRKSKTKFQQQQVKAPNTSPRLVVGIVVDQMRYDYLTRFWNHYGEGGFKRLVNEGFNCKNNHFNYAPTKTGPGHASVFTGTTPAVHGIIANDWYDKDLDRLVYCTEDQTFGSVGTSSDAGKMSPQRMLVTTVGDQLRLHTQMRGKTIAVSLKDRGAILPGGHTANAAYWFHGQNEGLWISSTFYMTELPAWVNDFNVSDAVEQYKKVWSPIKDINSYLESGSDANKYERLFVGETTSAFPHDLVSLWDLNEGFDILKATPFGNSITTDFALAALKGEKLGQDTITDFFAISFSSTDYVGHHFGVNSKEVQDTYVRLDKDLERLLNALDEQVGATEYTVFLTADHGAIHVPAFLKDKKILAGYSELAEKQSEFDDFLKYTFGTTDIVKNISNDQVFLDHKIIGNLDLEIKEVQQVIAQELLGYSFIERVYTGYQMWNNPYNEGIPHILQNGYHQKRSGDVLMVLSPGTVDYDLTGSTHGTPQIYDTHVPLLFYGKGIKNGSTFERTEIPDIAPTIASLLGIAFPNGATGKTLEKVLK